MAEQPFTLHVPDSELEYLKKKLELTRFPDELEGAAWDYGVPLSDVKRLVARWTEGFDWRASEAHINTFPQFTRDIEVEGHGTLNIHYVHKKSELEGAIPLMFVHGCQLFFLFPYNSLTCLLFLGPGHFMEVSKILPLLTAVSPDQPSFHVVAFSLPGYGWSDAPKKPGFAAKQFAEVGHKLMLSLGYKEYGWSSIASLVGSAAIDSIIPSVTQGGDWGHIVSYLYNINMYEEVIK